MKQKNIYKNLVNDRWLWVIATVSIVSIMMSIYYLPIGRYGIFQNILYLPIVVACFRYPGRGFIFSCVLILACLGLILMYTQEPAILSDAVIRALFFLALAAVTSSISNKRKLVGENGKMQAVLDAIPDVLYEMDREGLCYFFHASNHNLHCRKTEEAVGRSIYELMPPEIADTVRLALEEADEKGVSIGKVFSHNLRKGLMWFELSVSRMAGDRLHFIVLVRDVTDRIRASEYRSMGNDILKILNEPSPLNQSIRSIISLLKDRMGSYAIGIRLKDGFGYPYFAQEGFSDNLISKESKFARCCEGGDLCLNEEGNACQECVCGLVISGKTDPSKSFFTPGGSFWTNDFAETLNVPFSKDIIYCPRNRCIDQGYASVMLVPIRVKNEIVGMLQINDRRKGHFSFSAIEQIEGIAAHIGEALARKNAEKALLETERLSTIGKLSSRVAHDFNNSLAVMQTSAEMALLNLEDPVKVAKYVGIIEKCVANATSRVRKLQRFNRKVDKTNYEALDMNELLENVVSQNEPLWEKEARKKGLSFSIWRSYGKIDFIDGEEGEINSVLQNVLKNAIEAMPNGGTITLKTGVTDIGVCVWITDTGMGMDDETKNMIFETLFTTKGFESGRGLGMDQAYLTIRDHGGRISVKETEIGKGTTIEILLPIGTKKPEKSAIHSSNIIRSSIRILWVEDDKHLRELSKEFLERLGYSADIACDGKEAIGLLEKNRYDLLFTDIMMPVMGGWELVMHIKGKYEGMKVAVVSGIGDSVSDKQRIEHGVVRVITKPITRKMLDDVVREMIK